MPPREANNPFADQYLTIEYDATAMIVPHDTGPALPNLGNLNGIMDMDHDMTVDPPTAAIPIAPTNTPQLTIATSPENLEGNDTDGLNATNTQVVNEVQIGEGMHSESLTLGNDGGNHLNRATNVVTPLNFRNVRRNAFTGASEGTGNNNEVINSRNRRRRPFLSSTEGIHNHSPQNGINPYSPSLAESDPNSEIDPLAIDMSGQEEEENWNRTNSTLVEAAIASAEGVSSTLSVSPLRSSGLSDFIGGTRIANSVTPGRNPGLNLSNAGDSSSTPHGHALYRSQRGGFVSPTPGDLGNVTLPPHPGQRNRRRLHRGHSIASVLDQEPSMSCSEDEIEDGVDAASNTEATSNSSFDEILTTPNTPVLPHDHLLLFDNSNANSSNTQFEVSDSNSFSNPFRRSRSRSIHSLNGNLNLVTDEDASTASSSPLHPMSTPPNQSSTTHLTSPPPPRRYMSGSSAISRSSMSSSGRSIHWNAAFDSSSSNINYDGMSEGGSITLSLSSNGAPSGVHDSNPSPNQQISLSFGPNTTVVDLKYFAERGCIVPLLKALTSSRLKTLGTRMLADYAKMPNRRVAVASNKRILEFCCRTMLELPNSENMGTEWPAREYAVETIRSLTATEDSDGYLMGCNGMLRSLAVVARGGPFLSPNVRNGTYQTTSNSGLVSGKARLHACIAIMNLSCGKANKVEIASITEVLDAMRDVMMSHSSHFSPATSSPVPNSTSSNATPKSVCMEARLKAATCIKNLSNADANDAALLQAQGLVNALAKVAVDTCSGEKGATNCTTNACLALMNLSISKDNKQKVFEASGVMDALMTVLKRTSPVNGHRANNEARIKACSALSNLAIGYSNKIPMFNYPGFVDCILQVIKTDSGEARTKACSILWSFAAEMKNQVPVVKRGDILPTLVRVAEEDHSTEARFKCVAALTLLAESLENAMPLLESGALHPLMDILHDAGADPTQWKGQTASWCVGFLMNMAQSDEAAPYLREAGVVELLAPLLTLDHYQSLKAAMAVTFVCRYDEDDETYDLLRKTENVIPKIIDLLHNTLGGKGGKGYKYGVFTLRSSVGCISSLASGPEFMKERIATKAVFESLLRVVSDFCVNAGTEGAIVGGGRDDAHSSTLAVRALQALTEYLIPIPGSSSLPFGPLMDDRLMTAMQSFSENSHPDIKDEIRTLARDTYQRIQKSLELTSCHEDSDSGAEDYSRIRNPTTNIIENSIVASLVQGCCIGPSLHGLEGGFFPSMVRSSSQSDAAAAVSFDSNESSSSTTSQSAIRTFLLADTRTGRRFAVPTDPSGGRAFNDGRRWCYRRGRFCKHGEVPDPNFQWTDELQSAYTTALRIQRNSSASQSSNSQSSTIFPATADITTEGGTANSSFQAFNHHQGSQ